jgi:hypothetical protein
MSATAFLVARKGDEWSLEATGIPVAVRKEFKRISSIGSVCADEVLYFDTYGQQKRKRLKPTLFTGIETFDTEYTGDEPPKVRTRKGK